MPTPSRKIIPCDGFLLELAGEVLTAGLVPDLSDRQSFTEKVRQLAQGKPFVTNCLAQLAQELGKHSHIAAGVIAIPLSANHQDIAIWMRAEQQQSIKWGW